MVSQGPGIPELACIFQQKYLKLGWKKNWNWSLCPTQRLWNAPQDTNFQNTPDSCHEAMLMLKLILIRAEFVPLSIQNLQQSTIQSVLFYSTFSQVEPFRNALHPEKLFWLDVFMLNWQAQESQGSRFSMTTHPKWRSGGFQRWTWTPQSSTVTEAGSTGRCGIERFPLSSSREMKLCSTLR